MDTAALDISALIVNAPLAGVIVYLFQEVQRLHRERQSFMERQLETFQRAALKAGQDDA